MTVRTSVSALMEDFERASGSCAIQAKAMDLPAAMFMAGAATALELWPSCRKPEEFGSLVATRIAEWEEALAE